MEVNLINEKNILRKKILDLRQELSQDEQIKKSKQIINTLTKLQAFKDSNFVMCYLDFRNEVRTLDFINYVLGLGKRISVPYIIPQNKNKEMLASEIYELNQLESGSYGILEPKKKHIREISPNMLDLIIVPGVGFDVSRNRLGFGAGYYDRFLAKVKPKCNKVGIAFELQILDEIPIDNYDIPLDMIITEKRIIK